MSVTVNSCDSTDCINNKEGLCNAPDGITISDDFECEMFDQVEDAD